MMLEPMGLAAGPVVPTREWRELYAALDCARGRRDPPFYTASVREFEAAGRAAIGSAPVGLHGTAAWLAGRSARRPMSAGAIDAAKEPHPAGHPGALAAADQGPHHAERATGLGTAGRPAAGRKQRRPALRRHGMSARRGATRTASGSKGVRVQFRASLEQDLEAMASSSGPRHRHHAGGAGGQGTAFRRCISPT